ncbi:hypothetical protein PT974_09484 [Cladobotryum mycophilum]|uniref:Uncharacterized protein n=1 Tax=Cladobotryum mycophilum TaxID=491253 RepID=A0ABR0SHN1_9HYPO
MPRSWAIPPPVDKPTLESVLDEGFRWRHLLYGFCSTFWGREGAVEKWQTKTNSLIWQDTRVTIRMDCRMESHRPVRDGETLGGLSTTLRGAVGR